MHSPTPCYAPSVTCGTTVNAAVVVATAVSTRVRSPPPAQALILAAFPLFPMGTVFIAPFLILSFKFEMNLLTTFQVCNNSNARENARDVCHAQ